MRRTIFICLAVASITLAIYRLGRFADAISAAQKAIVLARENGEPDVLQKQELLERYRQHGKARQ
jgi:hypothetical protein